MERDVRHHRLSNIPWIIDFFSSIRLGIFLIAAIILYSALGSAWPEFRQQFELTEFQYFNHWAFGLLIALFCINLTVTTVRRIKFNVRNAGVLTVHAGLLTLCAGSVVYFGRKVEGDVWLDAPRVEIVSLDRLEKDPDRAVLDSVIAFPGQVWETNMPMMGGHHRVEVTNVTHQGLTTAASVDLLVAAGDKAPTPIHLDQSERKKMVARLSDRIALVLRGANISDQFYDDTTPVLLARAQNAPAPEMYELPSLPYYRESFVPGKEVIRDTRGVTVEASGRSPIPPFEKWQMPISLQDPTRAADADWPITLEIDGYLPYAVLQQTPVPGGDKTEPIVKFKLAASGRPGASDSGKTLEEWLLATQPNRAMAEADDLPAAVEFNWIGSDTQLNPEWTRPVAGSHVLDVFVKDKNLHKQFDVSLGQKIAVDGTDYKLTIEELRPSWPLMTAGFQGARTPIALIWVESPGKSFQRSVLARFPKLNQDRDRAGKKISPTANLVDENLELAYTAADRDFIRIVAGEKLAPTLIHTAPGGKRSVHKVEINKPIVLDNGKSAGPLTFALEELIANPVFESRPMVVPDSQRRPFGSVRRGSSLIRVHLAAKDGKWSKRIWVPFSTYNADHPSEFDTGEPTIVQDVPGLGAISLIYGRTPRRFPGRISLERLKTDFYPGRQQPSEWTSFYRYEDPATGQVHQAKVFLNNTARLGDWTLFQSQAAGDHKSWTVLGVGNRQGVLTMLLGCGLIAVGMAFAFFVKPTLVRRRKEQLAAMNEIEKNNSRSRRTPVHVAGALLALVVAIGAPARAQEPGAEDAAQKTDLTSNSDASLATFASQIDLDQLAAISLQHSWRYSTLDSWARDSVKTIHGPRKLWDIEPLAAAMEIMFNADAHRGEPIIFIKDKVLIRELTSFPVVVDETERRRMFSTGLVSYDFLNSPAVLKRIRELQSDMLKRTPLERLSSSLGLFEKLAATFTVVPNPKGSVDTPWTSPVALSDATPPEIATGLEPGQAGMVVTLFDNLHRAWRARDVNAARSAITGLRDELPKLAPPGVYPSLEKRHAEMRYRRMGLMTWAWGTYIFCFFISIFAVGTGYRWVRALGLVVLFIAAGLHATDLGMRWQVIGRIPVANMYEAIVSSTFVGVIFGLILELVLKRRVFLLSAALLGFFALALPELLPSQVDNRLSSMMPILDDIMLRIHTVLIISSYAVITLAFGVANCYLVVAAFRDRVSLAQGTIGAQLGALACLGVAWMGNFEGRGVPVFILTLTATTVGGAVIAIGLCSAFRPHLAASPPSASALDVLREFDLSQRILLHTAMIALFVGLVLGAIWADYSWGRPWGWDPKEVFALNTWLVYAILVHATFVSRRRALVTSILAVVGFAAMQFNWWVVNFHIVGLHSYA